MSDDSDSDNEWKKQVEQEVSMATWYRMGRWRSVFIT